MQVKHEQHLPFDRLEISFVPINIINIIIVSKKIVVIIERFNK